MAGQGWIQGRSAPVLSARNRRSPDTNNSPGKHRATALGGEAAEQAEHCKDSSCKGKFPDRAERKASSTAQSQGNSTLILLEPHSILQEHPGTREVPTQEPRSRRDQKVPGSCQLYTPSTRIPDKRSLCCTQGWQEEKLESLLQEGVLQVLEI